MVNGSMNVRFFCLAQGFMPGFSTFPLSRRPPA